VTGPKRATKGSIGGALLLRLPNDLRRQIEKAAKRAGLSSAEWVRRACVSQLPQPTGEGKAK
jgi:predicted HicB family RNase H-like nuclease